MARERCPVHHLIIADGAMGCIRCQTTETKHGNRRVLFGALAITVFALFGISVARTVVMAAGATPIRTEPAVATPTPTTPESPDVKPSAPAITLSRTTPRPAATAQSAAPSDVDRENAEMRSVRVTLYSADYCGWCKKAKAWMNARGVQYTERRTDLDPDASREMSRIGGRGLPTFDIEGEVHSGYAPDWLEVTLRRRAQAHLASRR